MGLFGGPLYFGRHCLRIIQRGGVAEVVHPNRLGLRSSWRSMCVLGISPPQYERYPGVSFHLLAAAGVLVVFRHQVLQRPRLLTPILIVLPGVLVPSAISVFMFD
jgi:hypothetical protein